MESQVEATEQEQETEEIFRFKIAWRTQLAGIRRVISPGYWETTDKVLAAIVARAKGVTQLTEEEAEAYKLSIRPHRPRANMVAKKKKSLKPWEKAEKKPAAKDPEEDEGPFGSDEDESTKVTVADLETMSKEELALVIEGHGAKAPRRASKEVVFTIAKGLITGEYVKKEDGDEADKATEASEAAVVE